MRISKAGISQSMGDISPDQYERHHHAEAEEKPDIDSTTEDQKAV